MAWKYRPKRRSIKLLPGIRLNLNQNSTSVSFGDKGHRTTINSNGKATRSRRILGASFYETSSVGKNGSAPAQEPSAKNYRISGIILQVLSAILFAMSLLLALVSPAALIGSAFAALLFFGGRKYKNRYTE